MSEGAATRTKPFGPTAADLARVSPALARYTVDNLVGDVWMRAELSARDRSLVTLAAQIARNQTVELAHQMTWGLDNGVTPAELSELITHLAFYTGWANAVAAVVVAKDIFDDRDIGADQLPCAEDALLPLDEAAETKRESTVSGNFGTTSPGVVQYTRDLLFNDLWLRPGLAPRDRSLVTVSALIAGGQVAQIPYHLNRAMDNGLTQAQASEVLTHIAFYAGWPNIFSSLPVFKEVFGTRAG